MVQTSVVRVGMILLTPFYKKIWVSIVLELRDLTLIGEEKWYLGMCIRQHKDHIILDQDQYVKNITSRFEK